MQYLFFDLAIISPLANSVYLLRFVGVEAKERKKHCLIYLLWNKSVVFGSHSLKMSVSFDKNLWKSIILQYYLVVTLEVSILLDINSEKMRSIIS